jgi:hypothetical protein
MKDNYYKITKEDVKTAFLSPIKIRGMVLKDDVYRTIREKLGEEAIRVIEKKIKELGFPFELSEIKDLEWYPAGVSLGIWFILQEEFNFEEKDFAELGEMAPKVSSIMRFLMKYFTVPKKIAKIGALRLWRRYFNSGKVEISDFQESKTEGFLIVRIKDFKIHPLHFLFLGYYFLGILRMARKFKESTVEETKSPFKGDEYEEYLIQWKH